MSGKNYFLDTNIVVPFLNGESTILTNIRKLEVIHIPVIVLGELYYGAKKSSRFRENIEKIKAFVSQCEIYPVDETIVENYGEIKSVLANQGTPIPENDIWIAAIVKEYNLPIVTRDKHFRHIPVIEVIEW